MNTIVAIWHPYCRYCSKAYSALEGLIGNNEQMRLVLMFKISSEEKQANLVVQFFRTIAKKNDIILTKQVLSDWYVISDRNYSWFAKKYLIEDCFINQVPEKEYAMEKWCNEAKIIHIPTFFINGRKLSDKYDFNDIKTIMDFQ